MKLTFRSEYRMHCLATLQAGHRGGASSCASSGAHMRSARAATPVTPIRDDAQGVGLTTLRSVYTREGSDELVLKWCTLASTLLKRSTGIRGDRNLKRPAAGHT